MKAIPINFKETIELANEYSHNTLLSTISIKKIEQVKETVDGKDVWVKKEKDYTLQEILNKFLSYIEAAGGTYKYNPRKKGSMEIDFLKTELSSFLQDFKKDLSPHYEQESRLFKYDRNNPGQTRFSEVDPSKKSAELQRVEAIEAFQKSLEEELQRSLDAYEVKKKKKEKIKNSQREMNHRHSNGKSKRFSIELRAFCKGAQENDSEKERLFFTSGGVKIFPVTLESKPSSHKMDPTQWCVAGHGSFSEFLLKRLREEDFVKATEEGMAQMEVKTMRSLALITSCQYESSSHELNLIDGERNLTGKPKICKVFTFLFNPMSPREFQYAAESPFMAASPEAKNLINFETLSVREKQLNILTQAAKQAREQGDAASAKSLDAEIERLNTQYAVNVVVWMRATHTPLSPSGKRLVEEKYFNKNPLTFYDEESVGGGRTLKSREKSCLSSESDTSDLSDDAAPIAPYAGLKELEDKGCVPTTQYERIRSRASTSLPRQAMLHSMEPDYKSIEVLITTTVHAIVDKVSSAENRNDVYELLRSTATQQAERGLKVLEMLSLPADLSNEHGGELGYFPRFKAHKACAQEGGSENVSKRLSEKERPKAETSKKYKNT